MICCDIEFYGRELLSSFMTACLDVESAGHVLKCRVSWLRAKTCCDIVHIENVLEKQKSLSYKMVFDLKSKLFSLKVNNITVIERKGIAKSIVLKVIKNSEKLS